MSPLRTERSSVILSEAQLNSAVQVGDFWGVRKLSHGQKKYPAGVTWTIEFLVD